MSASSFEAARIPSGARLIRLLRFSVQGLELSGFKSLRPGSSGLLSLYRFRK